MSRLKRLSGEACTYFVRDRCTRTRSPEESAEAKCALLEERRKVGAQTLDRLERIKRLADAEDREVARRHVIQKNLEAMTKLSCPGFVPASGEGPVCVHQHLVYCLLLLPACTGRCEDFLVRREPGARAKGN
ncbi:hypothetical protein AAU61_20210 [Desulfocarbo indianensis]|nr:hypothetical protein AAU61_20210 [Desulfocarbo indianensis]